MTEYNFVAIKKNSMKRFCVFTILFALSIVVFSQKAVITGEVLDNNNRPLPGATIIISTINKGTASDINGHFTISNLTEGTYSLEARYIGYSTKTVDIDLRAGSREHLVFLLEEGIDIEPIIISDRIAGESKALNRQKTNLNITNVVSSEQIERFPDANIGDALKRLSGINVMYDQGEARFGVIRGTQPELNSVTINGERIPSAEAEKRYVQLDLVPSDMIQTIEVHKALTPDMDADAIGGSVNLVTKSAIAGQSFSGSLGTGYNFISGKLVEKANLVYSTRVPGDRLGLVLNASVFNNPMESHNIEGEWDYLDEMDKDGTAYPSNFETRQYFVTRFRQSYSLAADYKINTSNKIFFSGIYNWRNDFENRYRLRYKDIEWDDETGSYFGEVIRQVKGGSADTRDARLEDQRMYNFRLGGDHNTGILHLDWSASYSKASEERTDERYLAFSVEDVEIFMPTLDENKQTPDVYTDPEYDEITDSYGIDELTEEYQLTEEIDKNLSVNLELPLLKGKFKFGGRYRDKSKTRDNEFYEYEPVNEEAFINSALAAQKDFSDSDFLAGDYMIGSFVPAEYLGDLDLNSADFDGEEVIEELAGNFNASEKVISGYAMFTGNLGSKISLLAGVRLENTILEYQGFEHFVDENDPREEWLEQTDLVEDSYLNIMPSVHIKYTPVDNMNLRLAWTNTLARPNYFDLVPYREINADDSELGEGNPFLIPTTSMNFDLLGEYFFENVGIISGGLFYKKLDNVIAMTIDDDYQFNYNGNVESWEYVKPENVGNGILFGFEGSFSKRLSFLPGFLGNISFYTNYTYNYSRLTDISVDGREDEELQIPGSPKHLINLSLAYDTKKFDLRLSYNHASAFRDGEEGGYGEEAFYDRWYDKVDYLDINANLAMGKNLKLYLEVNNLLNQPLRYYQGIEERTMQAEFYGIRVKTGIKFDF
jgi:TonB-dependent receptor